VGAPTARKPLLDIPQLVEWLNVSEGWVRKNLRPGAPNPLPHIKVGRYIRFDPQVIEGWLESRRHEGRSAEWAPSF
jgi:predicted DNA-binding transcriptional regulator AlpA